MNKNKIVTSIAFDESADRELIRLVNETSAASKAEVIRNAISLFSFVERELQGGGELLIERDGIASRVLVPGLARRVEYERARRAGATSRGGRTEPQPVSG